MVHRRRIGEHYSKSPIDNATKILTYFHTDPRQTVYVGDSDVDARTAEGAGVFFVAYKNAALSADYHLNRMEDLEAILNGTPMHAD